jgi:hypothetical protein
MFDLQLKVASVHTQSAPPEIAVGVMPPEGKVTLALTAPELAPVPTLFTNTVYCAPVCPCMSDPTGAIVVFHCGARPRKIEMSDAKEDLIDRVWDGAFIEDSNITKCVAEIRQALRVGFRGIDPIMTVWKQGYRFVVPVEISAANPTPAMVEKPVEVPRPL